MQTMELMMLEAGMALRESQERHKKYRCHIYAESKLIQLKLFACCLHPCLAPLQTMQGKFERYARVVNFAFSELDLGVFYGAQSLAKLIKCLK